MRNKNHMQLDIIPKESEYMNKRTLSRVEKLVKEASFHDRSQSKPAILDYFVRKLLAVGLQINEHEDAVRRVRSAMKYPVCAMREHVGRINRIDGGKA